jgi:hypothetical protein
MARCRFSRQLGITATQDIANTMSRARMIVRSGVPVRRDELQKSVGSILAQRSAK